MATDADEDATAGRSAPGFGPDDFTGDMYGCESALPFLTDAWLAPCAEDRPHPDGHRDATRL